jgi:elongation factor G
LKAYNAKDIRNIAIAGHSGRGKTTLAEAMLYLAKATDRLGRVADGNTVLDYDAEEKRRKASISTAMAGFEWNNAKINILDTPGLFDFAGGVAEGIRAAEAAVIVLASGSGIDVGAEKAYKAADKRGIAKIFAVSRCDAENADFGKTLDALKEEYGAPICPVVVHVSGTTYVDFSTGKAYEYNNGKASEVAVPDDAAIADMQAAFTEAVASADEELMEKFFMEEPLTPDEIAKGLKAGILNGDIYPVYACSGYNTDAVDLLLNGIVASAPDATHAAEGDVKVDENDPVAAICFKTIDDRFGKMSFFKVISGKLSGAVPAYNSRTDSQEKIGKMLFLKGEKQEDATEIVAGDIGIVTKLDSFKTGDTLCPPKSDLTLAGVNYPAPCLSMAIRAKKKGEEDKVAAGLNRIINEDPTVSFTTNVETHEQVVSALGEQHLDAIVTKLKNKFNVEVELSVPKVAYRETISKTASVQGRHKKQSGGSGQFGDVWIRFEPQYETDDLVFAEEVFGGSVPKNFFPSVEKGLRNAVQKGVLAGYPLVGLKATLYDGSYHPVDSNDMAFQTAARLAYQEGIPNAKPTILEPIGTLKVTIPDANLGDIMSDISSKRRGTVLGMTAADGMQIVEAEVPMAEMSSYTIDLRSMTQGRGSFTLEFNRYQEAPQMVQQKVIADAKASEA